MVSTLQTSTRPEFIVVLLPLLRPVVVPWSGDSFDGSPSHFVLLDRIVPLHEFTIISYAIMASPQPPHGSGNGKAKTIQLLDGALTNINDIRHQLKISGLTKRGCISNVFFFQFEIAY